MADDKKLIKWAERTTVQIDGRWFTLTERLVSEINSGTFEPESCEKCSKKAFVTYWIEDKGYLRCPYCGRPLRKDVE